VVSVVVPSMLAVLPYARGRGFDSRSRLPLNSCCILPLTQLTLYDKFGAVNLLAGSCCYLPFFAFGVRLRVMSHHRQVLQFPFV
jgi:hypothetical protein